MKAQRINNSSTIVRYKLTFDQFEPDPEPHEVADSLEPMNYGFKVEQIAPDESGYVLAIYID